MKTEGSLEAGCVFWFFGLSRKLYEKAILFVKLYLLKSYMLRADGGSFCRDQKNFHRLSRKPGMTTIRKKAQLTKVKTLTNFRPLPGYSRT